MAHWLDGHEFEQAPGVGDGQGSLACCSPWGHKESDMTERLNWTELKCTALPRYLISSSKSAGKTKTSSPTAVSRVSLPCQSARHMAGVFLPWFGFSQEIFLQVLKLCNLSVILKSCLWQEASIQEKLTFSFSFSQNFSNAYPSQNIKFRTPVTC